MPSSGISAARCSGVVIRRGARAGATTLRGMRIEGEPEGFQPCASASSFSRPQNAAVADVHAIEVADGEGARSEIRRQFVQAAEDAHG